MNITNTLRSRLIRAVARLTAFISSSRSKATAENGKRLLNVAWLYFLEREAQHRYPGLVSVSWITEYSDDGEYRTFIDVVRRVAGIDVKVSVFDVNDRADMAAFCNASLPDSDDMAACRELQMAFEAFLDRRFFQRLVDAFEYIHPDQVSYHLETVTGEIQFGPPFTAQTA